jgi:hypothetical protein
VPLQDLKSMDVDYERLGAVLDVIQRGWLKAWVDRNLK